MAGYEDLIAALASEQIDPVIAQDNPWGGITSSADSIGQLVLKSTSEPSLMKKGGWKDAVKYSLATGLISGLFGKLGENRAEKQKKSYTQLLTEALKTGDVGAKPEGMSDKLYDEAVKQTSLMKIKSMIEDSDMEREINKTMRMEQAKKQGELSAYGVSTGAGAGGTNIMNPVEQEKNKMAEKLRNEISADQTAKNYASIQPSLKAMVKYANEDTLTSDLPFVYEMVKVLDPGSVVREGEIALAQGTRSPLAAFKGELARVAGGSRMTPEVKQELMALALLKGKAIREQYNSVVQPRIEIAKQYGIDPSQLAIPTEQQLSIPSMRPNAKDFTSGDAYADAVLKWEAAGGR